MQKKIALNFIAFTASFTIMSCDKLLLEKESDNNAVSNFEVLWQEFDEKYGLFQTKNIDWDSIYLVYRPLLDETSGNEDFYSITVEIFGLLNDSHVALVPSDPNYPFYVSGVLGTHDTINDFDLDVVTANYLIGQATRESIFTYGVLADNVGYIYIEKFGVKAKSLEKPLDNIIEELKGTSGIVIDVRGGYGGSDLAGQYIAGRFTSQTIPYMKTRVRSGPGENDFTNYSTWSVQPERDSQYLKPIVVLTNRFTVSARETFCLAMKVQNQVTFVGDTTTGAFSDQINRELPNGWGYALSIGDWRTADEVTYEGIGLPPDILIQNQKQDVLNGIDNALEEAITILK